MVSSKDRLAVTKFIIHTYTQLHSADQQIDPSIFNILSSLYRMVDISGACFIWAAANHTRIMGEKETRKINLERQLQEPAAGRRGDLELHIINGRCLSYWQLFPIQEVFVLTAKKEGLLRPRWSARSLARIKYLQNPLAGFGSIWNVFSGLF